MSAPPAIPDHTLLRPIGRGAYGEVWLARNVMGAPRAVKIIWRRHFDSERPYEREFAGIQRYEPVSRTTDGLVQVLHVGHHEAEGYFYCVMELADTADLEPYSPRTLRSDLKKLGRLSVADCLQVAIDLVSGLARLHEHGLVHRDVKPGNIIFVNGRAKLADIGLVSAGGEGRTFVGTEGYIPPEGPGTPVADIYALGICLYEAVTGYSPDRFPKVPAEWFSPEADAQPLEFQEIVLKACEGARERRYQSAEQMRADLALLQSGQSVRRMRALERRVARFRLLAVAALLTVLLALGGVLLAGYRARIEAKNRAHELALRQRAEVAELDARQQLYAALLREARATVQSREVGQRVRALDAIRRAAAISNSAELRREALAALAQPDLRFERELPASPEVTFMSLDPNFTRLAIGRGKGPIEIRSGRDNQILGALQSSTNLPAHVATWSADGQFLAVKRDHDALGEHADLEIWNVTNAQLVTLLRDVSWGSVSFHPKHHHVLIGATEASARIVDLTDGRELHRFHFAARPVHLKFCPDGTRFAAACWSANRAYEAVSVHDAGTGATLWANTSFWTNASQRQIASINWHSKGRWLAVPDSSGAVRLMDAVTGEMRTLGEHKAQAVTAEFSPDGRYLFSGGWERELICWDLHTMQRAFTIGVGGYEMQIRADGRQCAIRAPTALQLHALEMPLQREFTEDLGTHLRHANFSPDGRWLAASAEKRGAVWDLIHNGPATLLDKASDGIFYFTPDGRELFASSCLRWQIAPAKDPAAPPRVEEIPFRSPGGSARLCLGSNFVVLTSPKGSQVLTRPEIQLAANRWTSTIDGIKSASPDGRWLGIYRAFGSSLYVYRLPGLERAAKLTHPAAISSFQFSPATEQVAICSSQAGVEFWSTATWQRTRVLTNFVKVMIPANGGGWWLTKSFRNTGLYEPETLRELLPLPPDTLPLAVSGQGRHLAVIVDARRLQLWDMTEVRKRFRDLGVDWQD